MAFLKKRRKLEVVLLIVVAVGLIGYGLSGFWQRYRATHDPHPTVSHKVITDAVSHPDETPPVDACAAYKVAAQYPERIDIPEINASGCVERVGLTSAGAIATPTNIYTAAWYVRTVPPGQPGLSVIDGHISGRYKVNGIFQFLGKLKGGDAFTVTLGSGTVLRYQVIKEQSVPLNQAVQVLLTKDRDVVSQLNLITCGGQYDPSTKLYNHRIVVSAALVSG
jgi:LPXTG-site transpeptidase (sortase) family protein